MAASCGCPVFSGQTTHVRPEKTTRNRGGYGYAFSPPQKSQPQRPGSDRLYPRSPSASGGASTIYPPLSGCDGASNIPPHPHRGADGCALLPNFQPVRSYGGRSVPTSADECRPPARTGTALRGGWRLRHAKPWRCGCDHWGGSKAKPCPALLRVAFSGLSCVDWPEKAGHPPEAATGAAPRFRRLQPPASLLDIRRSPRLVGTPLAIIG